MNLFVPLTQRGQDLCEIQGGSARALQASPMQLEPCPITGAIPASFPCHALGLSYKHLDRTSHGVVTQHRKNPPPFKEKSIVRIAPSFPG